MFDIISELSRLPRCFLWNGFDFAPVLSIQNMVQLTHDYFQFPEGSMLNRMDMMRGQKVRMSMTWSRLSSIDVCRHTWCILDDVITYLYVCQCAWLFVRHSCLKMAWFCFKGFWCFHTCLCGHTANLHIHVQSQTCFEQMSWFFDVIQCNIPWIHLFHPKEQMTSVVFFGLECNTKTCHNNDRIYPNTPLKNEHNLVVVSNTLMVAPVWRRSFQLFSKGCLNHLDKVHKVCR